METITPAMAQQEIAAGHARLLDVRNPEEIDIVQVSGATVIPMNEIPERFRDLNSDERIIVMCHHGMRSERVARYLIKNGYSDVVNLEGGIDAWAENLDDTMVRY